ncbi:hypothetical protein TrRE_jg9637 [Triparma retinervis]|uniref:Prolyl 4-hydroxylase alpha subunit Fe(2+) 2OG dioxygenase domain-containing protein n=1 Tax=Triparma retinervis TaxID=2557542 RepID=A0A9W7C801_9STRA|nr:hypothetical protein TrRE_jg9637 [Triparma retinervis]
MLSDSGPCSELEARLKSWSLLVGVGEFGRLPWAVFGDDVPTRGANAPLMGDPAPGWHVDGDPHLLRPSAFTDFYGRYKNRSKGKPRLMTLLVYLSGRWDEGWGAGTEFLDTPTGSVYATSVRPGRCVLLDADVTHRVTNPKVGGRPRYSLAAKVMAWEWEGTEWGGERRGVGSAKVKGKAGAAEGL